MTDETFIYLHHLAIFCLQYGRFSDAIAVFELLDKISPGQTDILLGLAKAQIEEGDYESSLQTLNKINRKGLEDEYEQCWRWLRTVASAKHQSKQ